MPEQENPLAGYQIAVDIPGVFTGYFSQCWGLGSEHEVVEQKTVNQKGEEVIIKLPGRVKWDNIVLKRGVTSDIDIWKWRQQVLDGDVEGARRDGAIILYDYNLVEVARWEFSRAWPVKLSIPQPQADRSEFLIEELTLVPESIRRVR